jgi:tetratricopeptide (TPR) repeat protein
LYVGVPAESCEHTEAGRRIYDPERHRLHRELYGGHDPGVCASHIGAQVRWLLGYPETGLALGQEALTLAEKIAHPFSLALTLQYNSMLLVELGEPDLALRRLERAEALAGEQRLGLVLEPQLLRGAALALATVEEGLNTEDETGNRQLDAELHRLLGVTLSGLKRLEESEAALQDAVRIARRQQARAYELRAAMSLARRWRNQGKRREARDLLAPVYGWFTEGFDTVDLKKAKALLDELAA